MLDEFECELLNEILREAQKIRVQQLELIEECNWGDEFKDKANHAWTRLNKISELLAGNVKRNYIIDIDGTVSEDIPNEESHRFPKAQVLDKAVAWINKRYEAGHCITFFTAREEKDRKVTETWLTKYGFKYHKLLMDKPRGGNLIIVDNLIGRFVQYRGDFGELEDV